MLKKAMWYASSSTRRTTSTSVDNERDYGQETVEMLLQVMENDRNDLVVIMAGYKDKMDRFFNDVPGLSSRIGTEEAETMGAVWEDDELVTHDIEAPQRTFKSASQSAETGYRPDND